MMNAKIRMPRKIFLAHGDRKTLSILESVLRSLGHELTLVTTLGRELIDSARRNPPQMFISSPKLEDMDGIDALLEIGEFRPTPAIIVARDDDLNRVERATEDHVMGYLVEPITAEMLLPAIYLCEKRFNYFQELEGKVESLERRVSELRTIERAKLCIMRARNVEEPEAHRLLQRAASSARKRIFEVAQSILEAESALAPNDDLDQVGKRTERYGG